MAMPVSLVKGLPESREFLQGLRSPWIWAVLAVSLALVGWEWRYEEVRYRSQIQARFDRRVADIRGALLTSMNSQELVLRGGVGLHAAHDSVDEEIWRSYAQALLLDQRQTGIQGVGYARFLPPDSTGEWKASFRGQDDVVPEIQPAPRPGRAMAPILFLEPAGPRNRRAIGYDMFSEPVRRKAMERARDSGEPSLSGKVRLVQEFPQDPGAQAGFLMYLPAYRTGMPTRTVAERRAALDGFVYSPFRAGDLVRSVLPNLESGGVSLAIYDGEGTSPDSLLYASGAWAPGAAGARPEPIRDAHESGLERVEMLAMFGRVWTLHYRAEATFLDESRRGHAWLIPVLGGAASLFLAAALVFLSTTRERARRLAQAMTAELRELQAGLELQVAQRTRELESANRELAAEMARREAQEEQLRQSQKMEAIGRLAGGVAHDFNNLLTAINGYAALSLETVRDNPALRGNLEEIIRAGDMAAALTRQLLAYSRKQILSMRPVDLNAAVGEVGRLIRRLISADIEVDLRLSPDAGTVRVDPNQLQQALINLALNARDAMPGGGRLSIATGFLVLDRSESAGLVGEAARAGEGSIPAGRYSVLTVADTGEGMGEEVKSRLFEPYFTTKQFGRDKGTGLGLSMVYGIVRQSGGFIQVHSEPGRGTTFRILLPEHAGAAETAETTETT